MTRRVPHAAFFAAALAIVAGPAVEAAEPQVPLLRHQAERAAQPQSPARRQGIDRPQSAAPAAPAAASPGKPRTVAEMLGRMFHRDTQAAAPRQPIPAPSFPAAPRVAIPASTPAAPSPAPALPRRKVADDTAWPGEDGELPAAMALIERYGRARTDPAARRVDSAFSAIDTFALPRGPAVQAAAASGPGILAYAVSTSSVDEPEEAELVAIAPPRRPRPPTSEIERMIDRYANANGVPVDLARALVFVLSTYNPNARGAGGEIGLMQLNLATARGIGFTGDASELYDPETNLAWGMRYLGTAQKLGNGEVCQTLLRYNAGHYATVMNDASRKFCGKVQAAMASR